MDKLGMNLIFLLSLLCFCAICSAQEQPTAEELLNDLACGSCHDGISVESDIIDKTPDLSQAGLRYNPDHLYAFLQYPVKIRQHIGLSRMPIFHIDGRESLALTLHLAELRPPATERPPFELQQNYESARSLEAGITAETGEGVFYALNCLACHQQSSAVQWEEKGAPDLTYEGSRVAAEWLETYLREPTPVRPFGYFPGSGSRHPDFQMSLNEVETLTEYLMNQKGDLDTAAQYVEPERFLTFSATKAETLLREKLPCLGCHRLGDDGGRVAPDLSSIGARLQPEFVAQVIRDPTAVLSETLMPKVEMPDTTFNLIVNYLLHQELPRTTPVYPSLVDTPPRFFQGLEEAQSLYVKHCVPCHGINGNGDGFNAQYLPTAPTNHADSSYMATRPDDTLFDGIYSGGYILNKSNRMPPWGFTLEREQIWLLVGYLRQLCRCEGPAWSRDNR